MLTQRMPKRRLLQQISTVHCGGEPAMVFALRTRRLSPKVFDFDGHIPIKESQQRVWAHVRPAERMVMLENEPHRSRRFRAAATERRPLWFQQDGRRQPFA
jgi:hypothetical protein